MVKRYKRKRRRSRRPGMVQKPSGTIHPRVQKVGPEHFGIVSVDCAKARSKWMLCDFYGNVLIPPTTVDHRRPAFGQAGSAGSGGTDRPISPSGTASICGWWFRGTYGPSFRDQAISAAA